MLTLKVLCDSPLDFKYKNIYENIKNLKVYSGSFFYLIRCMFQFEKGTIYHFRYLKFRGYFFTLIRLFLIILVAKITKTKILWTCHNIYEHTFKSKRYNDFVRFVVCYFSDAIITFHIDVSEKLPAVFQYKIFSASFGDMKPHFHSQHAENSNFKNKYDIWLYRNNHKAPNLISVSTAHKNNLNQLNDFSKNSCFSSLIIAPNVKVEFNSSIYCMVYTEDFVKKEVVEILSNSDNLVGFVGHDNCSVPTSIYMFASFGIPVITLDNSPSNSIIKNNGIGKVLYKSSDLQSIYLEILDEYVGIKDNCKKFIDNNSWEFSSKVHNDVLFGLFTQEEKNHEKAERGK